MQQELQNIRLGLAMALLCLASGIGMGISFGANEEMYQAFIANGITAHSGLHDAASASVIWRWALRAHFHAAGIGAFTLVLLVLVALSGMNAGRKRATAFLLGLGGLYPMAWFAMFWLGPSIGRTAAHHHWLVEALTYVAVGGLTLGMLSLLGGLFLQVSAAGGSTRGADTRTTAH